MSAPINWLSEFKRLKANTKGTFVFIEMDSWLGGGAYALVDKHTPHEKVAEIAQSQYDVYMREKNERSISNQ